jgi:hypothetical protein
MRSNVLLTAVAAVAVTAGCSGSAASDGNRAPRATASGIAAAAPHAAGPGRATLGAPKATARKPGPTPEDDPFALPDADAGAGPGPTQL